MYNMNFEGKTGAHSLSMDMCIYKIDNVRDTNPIQLLCSCILREVLFEEYKTCILCYKHGMHLLPNGVRIYNLIKQK